MANVRPWYQNFQILAYIGGGLAALTVLGSFIVKSADYIKLPEVVAAETKRNDSQDQRLDKLITLQEYQQAANQQALHVPRNSPRFMEAATTEPIVETDQDGTVWCCDKATVEECWAPIDASAKNSWARCE